MARTVSSKVRKHVQSEIDPLVKVFLITIRHKDLAEPIRVSSDPTERVDADSINVIYGTVSRGMTFFYAGFEAALVSDEEGAAPQTQLSLPNADRKLVEAIESMGPGPVAVDIELVFADTPDVVEVGLYDMELSKITYDESTISGIVSRDLLFQEPYPCRSFIPPHYPFLFSSRRTLGPDGN